MANELYTRTNQKIFYAGLALEALGKAEESRAMNALALTQAEREAAVFHLYGALLGLCPQASAPRAELLLTREVLEAIAIPEMAELVELAHSPQTWLARLIAAHNALYLPPQAPRKPKGDVLQPLIEAVSLDAEAAPELGREELESWRQNLKVLAIRFRDGLSEC